MPTPTRTQTHDDDPGLTPGADTEERDNGPPRAGRDPERRCIATLESRSQSEMIRFVLSPDNVVTPDLAQRLPGRGAWTSYNRSSIDLAVQKKAFSRAFKRQVSTPEDLSGQVESLLEQRCLDLLGFAKRAGDLILGFDQARDAVRNARPACLIEAANGAADGRNKMLSLLKGVHAGTDNNRTPPVIGCFTAEQLGMALGRDRVIHAVVKQGRFSQALMAELMRLGNFRPLVQDDWTTGGRASPET